MRSIRRTDSSRRAIAQLAFGLAADRLRSTRLIAGLFDRNRPQPVNPTRRQPPSDPYTPNVIRPPNFSLVMLKLKLDGIGRLRRRPAVGGQIEFDSSFNFGAGVDDQCGVAGSPDGWLRGVPRRVGIGSGRQRLELRLWRPRHTYQRGIRDGHCREHAASHRFPTIAHMPSAEMAAKVSTTTSVKVGAGAATRARRRRRA